MKILLLGLLTIIAAVASDASQSDQQSSIDDVGQQNNDKDFTEEEEYSSKQGRNLHGPWKDYGNPYDMSLTYDSYGGAYGGSYGGSYGGGFDPYYYGVGGDPYSSVLPYSSPFTAYGYGGGGGFSSSASTGSMYQQPSLSSGSAAMSMYEETAANVISINPASGGGRGSSFSGTGPYTTPSGTYYPLYGDDYVYDEDYDYDYDPGPYVPPLSGGGGSRGGLRPPPTFSGEEATYFVRTVPLQDSGVYSETELYFNPRSRYSDEICFSGSASGLEPNLVSMYGGGGTQCSAANGCGVHIHAGPGCYDSDSQGVHYYNMEEFPDSDPWALIGYTSTNGRGVAEFSYCVRTGFDVANNPHFLLGRAFIVHGEDGSRLSCGIINPQ